MTCRRFGLGLVLACAACLALGGSRPARAQFQPFADVPTELGPATILHDADNTVPLDLVRSDAFLSDRQWDEAVDALQRLMENHGDRLVRSAGLEPEEFARYVPVRELCHARLATFRATAPEALRTYRQRVDPLAERWFRQAVETRDVGLLQRIVRQAFTSRFGDDALWLLGEYALERGDYTAARFAWESLSPALRAADTVAPRDIPGRSLWISQRGRSIVEFRPELARLTEPESAGRSGFLAFPDTDRELADVRARLALVSLLEGSPTRATWEIELLRRLHPDAEGRIAGRTGNYAALLTALLEQSRSWPPRLAPETTGPFADRPLEKAFEIVGPPLWSRVLPRLADPAEKTGHGRPRVAEADDGLLSYHPLVVDGHVFVIQPGAVRGWMLSTGQPAFPTGQEASEETVGQVYDDTLAKPRTIGPPRGPAPERPRVGVPRYTLTASPGKLFARIRSPLTATSDVRLPAESRGAILGLDLAAQGKMLPGFPLTHDEPHWSFEGSPIVVGSRLFVGVRKRDAVRDEAHVACYEVATGRRLWRTGLVGASTPGHGQWDEQTHNLLTVRDDVVYCNTNLGAVAALSARDGSVLWLTRYPRSPFRPSQPDRNDRHFFRDRTPCLLHRDFVFVAPSDCDRLFALDAATGQLFWSTLPEQAADAVHLLGVTDAHLIASGDYLYWIDLFSGAVAAQMPPPGKSAPLHALPSPRGFGRGLLAGDRIYWPTRDALHVLRLAPEATPTGLVPRPARAPIDLRPFGIAGGNLVWSDGVLLIAGKDKLVALRTE